MLRAWPRKPISATPGRAGMARQVGGVGGWKRWAAPTRPGSSGFRLRSGLCFTAAQSAARQNSIRPSVEPPCPVAGRSPFNSGKIALANCFPSSTL